MSPRMVKVQVLETFPVDFQYQQVGTEIPLSVKKAEAYEARGLARIVRPKPRKKSKPKAPAGGTTKHRNVTESKN